VASCAGFWGRFHGGGKELVIVCQSTFNKPSRTITNHQLSTADFHLKRNVVIVSLFTFFVRSKKSSSLTGHEQAENKTAQGRKNFNQKGAKMSVDVEEASDSDSSLAKRLGQHFPLASVAQVRDLFSRELQREEPNLSLLSIVVGALEHQWTTTSNPANVSLASAEAEKAPTEVLSNGQHAIDPPLSWLSCAALLDKFSGILRGYCDNDLLDAARKENEEGGQEGFTATRALVKHVADIVWNTLSKSHYKDRPHLQSLYSYLTGNKLDCFGVAFAVVAACQMLAVSDVHLALSEDHAWVVFGKNGQQTAEVTWHGKGSEDKRGQPVDAEKAKVSWLYLAGRPVLCDRRMEVAALVSSVNPAVTASVDSVECGALQQELLWLLYDRGHLKRYPMALGKWKRVTHFPTLLSFSGNLGDLEEISPSLGRPPPSALFAEAVEADKSQYDNQHVYPYTYEAGFFYRRKQYKKALESWAGAADAIRV